DSAGGGEAISASDNPSCSFFTTFGDADGLDSSSEVTFFDFDFEAALRPVGGGGDSPSSSGTTFRRRFRTGAASASLASSIETSSSSGDRFFDALTVRIVHRQCI